MTSFRRLLDSALARLAEVGAEPGDDEETRLQKALLVLIAILILPIAGIWAVLYLALGAWTGWAAVLYAVISVASIAVFARTRDFGLLLNIQLLDIALAPTLSMIFIGGFLPTGGVGLWGILAPLGALVFRGVGSGIRWFVLWLILFLGSGVAAILLGGRSPLPEWFSSLMLALNISVSGVIVFTLLALFAKQRQDALVGLRSAQERAENLLLNILPGSIAERLKESPQTIADQFPAASVLFADVVDFTPRSNDLTAAEVVGLLDRLFGEFDALAERHGLEKIKTIGDAYMVASGVPDPRPDHARVLARLALDMVAATRSDGAVGDLDLVLRIGINSGPVVAGVIGRKRFLYDLWGDAVNTASRMESQGTPDRIQITRATYELIKDEFECEYRGTVPVKGKGDIETWYLISGPRRVERSRARTIRRKSGGEPCPGSRTAVMLPGRVGAEGRKAAQITESVVTTHTDQKLELLKRVPLLAALGRRELEEVGRLVDEVDVKAGKVLMREGDAGSEFFVVVTGSVVIERGGTRVFTMGGGDFFGEIALIDEGPRTATATTEADSKLLVLGHREFHSLMEQFPAIRTCVLEALAKRIRRLEPEAAN